MKASILLFLLCLLCALSYGQGNIISVNNNAAAGADYTSLQMAIDSAEAGDVIYVYPSASSYGNITLNKGVTLFGPGYQIGQNSEDLGVTTVNGEASIGTLTIGSNCSNATISSFKINFIPGSGFNNVIIQRNWITARIDIDNVDNVEIVGNYFSAGYVGDNINHCMIDASINVVIKNNIFHAFHSEASITTTNGCYDGSDNLHVFSSSAIIENNLFRDRVEVQNSVIRNNIFLRFSACGGGYQESIGSNSNNTINNNIMGFTTNYGSATNLISVPQDSITIGWPNQNETSFDSRYQLSSFSKARGAGTNGTDCGPFGGDTPYQLSGLPPIPLIYDIQAPATGTATQGLQVTIKARAID